MGISRFIVRLGLFGSGLFFATFVAICLWTFGDVWPPEEDVPTSDVILCLGAGADEFTGALGQHSTQRAETCARLYLIGKAEKIVFSGAGPKGLRSTASVMAELAKERGVPMGDIVIEPNARSTLQNVLFSMPLVPKARSVILVTDSFHLPRSWMSFNWLAAQDLTLAQSRAKDPEHQVMPKALVLARETLAIWFNALRFPVYWATKQLNVSNAVDILH